MCSGMAKTVSVTVCVFHHNKEYLHRWGSALLRVPADGFSELGDHLHDKRGSVLGVILEKGKRKIINSTRIKLLTPWHFITYKAF